MIVKTNMNEKCNGLIYRNQIQKYEFDVTYCNEQCFYVL